MKLRQHQSITYPLLFLLLVFGQSLVNPATADNTSMTKGKNTSMNAVETVNKYLAHIFSGDMEKALELTAAEAKFISGNPNQNPDNPIHGTFIGHKGAQLFFSTFADLLEPGDFHVTAAFGDDAHAALYGTLRHKVRSTNKDFYSDWSLICRVVDGKITLYHFYEDTEALLKAMTD